MSEARELVPIHAVVDPVVTHVPLDLGSIAVYLAVFVAASFASMRRASYGVATMIVLVPFGFAHETGITTVTLSKVALLAAAAGLIATRRDLRAIGGPAVRAIVACAFAVLVATACSFVDASHHAPVWRETLKAAEYLAIFVVVALSIAADPGDRAIRVACVAIAIVVSVLAIAQEVLGAPSGLWFDNLPIPRIAGPLEGPNQLAAYLGIVLAVVAAYSVRRDRTPFELVALALGSAALVLTISRAGAFASLLGIAVVLAVSAGARRRVPVACIAAGCLAGCIVIGAWGYAAAHSLIGLDLLKRFASLAADSAPGRLGTREQLWHAALVLWRSHPVFGVGAGNYELDLGLAGYPLLHTHANSLYLQALAEGGVPLALATLALVYVSIATFARGPFAQPLVAGALGASIGLATHQIFDLLAFFPKIGEMWWIVLALGAIAVDRAKAEPRAEYVDRTRPRVGLGVRT